MIPVMYATDPVVLEKCLSRKCDTFDAILLMFDNINENILKLVDTLPEFSVRIFSGNTIVLRCKPNIHVNLLNIHYDPVTFMCSDPPPCALNITLLFLWRINALVKLATRTILSGYYFEPDVRRKLMVKPVLVDTPCEAIGWPSLLVPIHQFRGGIARLFIPWNITSFKWLINNIYRLDASVTPLEFRLIYPDGMPIVLESRIDSWNIEWTERSGVPSLQELAMAKIPNHITLPRYLWIQSPPTQTHTMDIDYDDKEIQKTKDYLVIQGIKVP